MALTTSNAGDFTTVRSLYNLQTQQKRIRHLRSISVRNLHSGATGSIPLSRLQCYFTLHTHVNGQVSTTCLPPPDEGLTTRPKACRDKQIVDSAAFYESEKITGSTNPSWQSFDISQFEDKINLASKFIVVRVWVGQQENFRLLILMEVHLAGLHFLTDKLQQLVVKHSPNLVIFSMLDKEFIFINKEQTRTKNLAKRVSDLDLPSSLLPAVVKVEKASVRNSYTTSALCRIQTVLRAIKQIQTHARSHRRQIEDRLLASQENSKRLEERENLHMSVGQLRRELLRRTTLLHQSQEKLHTLKEATTSRVETLQSDTQLLSDHLQLLQEDKRDHIVKREQLVKENALLSLRRRQMLNELFSYIYPITEEGNRFFINKVRLPHAEELHGQDEMMIAVGLGYSCHLTLKMAQILGLPLRHPVDHRGSKSVIYDQVHSKLADKDREFPLYSKGKDKNHFNYGVFLLNKNISQLRYQCSVATLDLRQTLQNLLTLMHKLGVRMEGDPSMVPTFTSTPEGTALSRTSPNGSSIGTNLMPAFVSTSANGDINKSQGSAPGQQHSKASDLSEEGSTGTNTVDNPTSRTKDTREHFDESEDIFKPTGDDHFFRVDSSFMEEFNASGEDRENHRHTDPQPEREDQESSLLRASALLQTDLETPRTFQLVREKYSSRKHGAKGDSDKNNSGENGLLDDADLKDSDEDMRAGGDNGVVHGGDSSDDNSKEKGGGTSSGSEVGDGDVSGDGAHSQSPSRVLGQSIGGECNEHLPQLTDIDAALLKEDG